MFEQHSTLSYQSFQQPETLRIAIIGLGYVGLPLAVGFAKKYAVKGFDIKQSRIDELDNNYDRALEISADHMLYMIPGQIRFKY
jgi:UDP-N-acetyl-D-galactosamine dehydrogenase